MCFIHFPSVQCLKDVSQQCWCLNDGFQDELPNSYPVCPPPYHRPQSTYPLSGPIPPQPIRQVPMLALAPPFRHSHRVTMSALAVSMAMVRGSLPSESRAPRSAPLFKNKQASLERTVGSALLSHPFIQSRAFLPMAIISCCPTRCGQEWLHGEVGLCRHCLPGSHLPHSGGETHRPEENSASRSQKGGLKVASLEVDFKKF